MTSLPTLTRVWPLPPLILHPFADPGGPGKLVKSSRASLMLQGYLPSEASDDDLDRALLDGRYCEIRMLFYVGKDLARWVEQCLEVVEREEPLRALGLSAASFAALLVEAPPEGVREKLRRWGVADYRAIFGRALGLNAMFADVPPPELMTDSFIRHYYRYADALFQTRQSHQAFVPIATGMFEFPLYASGEYSRMLEQEWGS